MRVVVLGATGNIGTSVLLRLSERERIQEIVGVARRVPARSFPKTRFVSADIAGDDLEPLLRGADALVHLAWRIQPRRREASLESTNVEGACRVFEAAKRTRIPTLVYASSVGAYSPAPGDHRVGEEHPTDGVPTSLYSRQKARVEEILDGIEREAPDLRIVRMRPALTFKRAAAWGIRRLFLGPFLPRFVFSGRLVPLIPGHRDLRAQAVHSLDVGEAFALAVTKDVRGAFNLAAEPVLRAEVLAERLRARVVRLPPPAVRAMVAAAYHLRLVPAEPGWVDLARESPLMRTDRARRVLGWKPRWSADEAIGDLLDGLADGSSFDTPPLQPQRGRAFLDALGVSENAQGSG